MGRTAALVPAAGRGERLGPGTPKALRQLAGVPMFVHAVNALTESRAVDLVIVAVPPASVDEVSALLVQQQFSADVSVVAGGDTRPESVARALIGLPADVDVVLVHDAARPLVPPELVSAVVAAVRQGHLAVVPGVAMVDTVKEVDAQSDVTSTPSRATLRAIQTPQGFTREVLQAAHAALDADETEITDDAGMVERMGVVVHVIPGHEEAFKVTRPIDLILAEAILAKRRAAGAV
ncbi:MAG: 2-C-methyl-D-erythritol 4-phosphate cytidylyltransferase [Actinomycetota bacterium]|nr:2-C-methyl-D-erythritol 4-phosphate cytidylyltransferase [Actinomycetota bacterium]